jgi:DNA processing protein
MPLQFKYTDQDKHFLLTLLSINGLGRKKARSIFYYLKKHEVKYRDFWVENGALYEIFGLKKDTIDSIKKFDYEKQKCSLLKLLKKDDIRAVFFWEKLYPPLLRECSDHPLILFVKGDVSLLQQKMIAVVGSRRMTSYGEMVTSKIVLELLTHNFVIVSGFMYGVDNCAHQTALNNAGKTVAVLGYGFDHHYPSTLRAKRDRMLEQGACFISEYFPWVPPNKGLFPERNRVVAGISLGVLVTEAAIKSGTHITAQCAVDEGREVFAVPGPITNPFSEGTKWLINQGARLVNSGDDIVLELNYKYSSLGVQINQDELGENDQVDQNMPKNRQVLLEALKPRDLDEVSNKILQELSFSSKSAEQLAKIIKIPLQKTLSTLSALEVENLVICEGQLWQLAV